MRVSLCQNWYELELIMCILFIWFFFLRFWQHEIKHSNQIPIQFEKKYIYPLITNKPVIYLYYLTISLWYGLNPEDRLTRFHLKKVSRIVSHSELSVYNLQEMQKTFTRPNKKIFCKELQWIDWTERSDHLDRSLLWRHCKPKRKGKIPFSLT